MAQLHSWLEPSIDEFVLILVGARDLPQQTAHRRWFGPEPHYGIAVGAISRGLWTAVGIRDTWLCPRWSEICIRAIADFRRDAPWRAARLLELRRQDGLREGIKAALRAQGAETPPAEADVAPPAEEAPAAAAPPADA